VNLAGLDLSIIGPAFLAGLLVLATHVPMGRQVLSRGIIFIDLAVAQVAGLGVIVADRLGWSPHGWAVQGAAVSAAFVGALVLRWTERRWPQVQEALIGVLFVLAASTALLLLAGNPHGGEQLRDLLVGQILWVTPVMLAPAALVYALVLAGWFAAGARLGRAGFYLLFALTVTVSVQLVGVYLVFASLILPALAGCRHAGPQGLIVGYATGIAGYASGLAASAWLDLPSGPAVVVALALWTAAAAAVPLRRSTQQHAQPKHQQEGGEQPLQQQGRDAVG